MSRNRGRRLRSLFDAACDLPAAERARLLDEECAGDASLRAEVEALLARDARDDSPLDGPFLRASDPELLPASIGPFRVTRVIGRGSSGTVFAARQEHPAREVAIKLLRPGLVDDDALRRFHLEVDILGRLRHENVARIFDAGEVDLGHGTQPYLVMELIDGISPPDFARAHGLGVAERLGLLARICDGVGHAHARGVIHRDLKAANILVDAGGAPRIVDFGIARVDGARPAGAPEATRAGQLLGTLETMSPEQARGESHAVDTRSDVYALGVIGYELLAGRPPYVLHDLDLPDALRVIRDRPAPPLGRLDPVLRGDVEVVLGKALRKDPDERYASASELADELRRCLRDEPITARPPSTRHQLARFARRNRALVGGGLVAAGVLVVAVVAVSLALLEARRSARERTEALAESQEVTRFLEELLRSADPELHGPDVRVRDVLDDASPRIAADFEDRPALAGRLLATIGAAFLGIGEYDAAVEELGEASRLLARGGGPRDVAVLDIRRQLALAHSRAGRHEEAIAILSPVRDSMDAVLGPRAEETLEAGIDLEIVRIRAGRVDGVVDRVRRLAEECSRSLGEDHPTTGRARHRLGQAHLAEGDLEGARVTLESLLDARRRRLGESHPDTRDTRALLAMAHQRAGRMAEAEALQRDDIRALEEEFGDDHPRTLVAVSRRAHLLFEQSRFDTALPLLRRAFDGSTARLGPRHPQTVEVLVYLAATLVYLGRLDEAAPLVTTARELAEETFGADGDETLVARTVYVALLRARGDTEGALTESLEVLALRRVAGEDPRQLVHGLYNVAQNELELGRLSDAEAHLEEACALGDERLGFDHPATLMSRSSLARIHLASGRNDEARRALDEIATRLRETLGSRHVRSIYADVSLGLAEFQLGEGESAVARLEDALGRVDDVLGTTHENAISIVCSLARCRAAVGRSESAEAELLARVKACESLAEDDPRVAQLAGALAGLYSGLGRGDEAAAWAARADVDASSLRSASSGD